MPLRRTEGPPPERTFWELLPRRNLRRVLFLVAVLFAVIILQRSSGRSFRSLFEAMAPLGPSTPAAPPAPAAGDQFHPIKVVPRASQGAPTARDEHEGSPP